MAGTSPCYWRRCAWIEWGAEERFHCCGPQSIWNFFNSPSWQVMSATIWYVWTHTFTSSALIRHVRPHHHFSFSNAYILVLVLPFCLATIFANDERMRMNVEGIDFLYIYYLDLDSRCHDWLWVLSWLHIESWLTEILLMPYSAFSCTYTILELSVPVRAHYFTDGLSTVVVLIKGLCLFY